MRKLKQGAACLWVAKASLEPLCLTFSGELGVTRPHYVLNFRLLSPPLC